jgi:hypothetical protein
MMNSKFLLLAAFAAASMQVHAQHSISFDADWQYTYAGEQRTVTLPHAWNEASAFAVAIADLPTDTVRYVKEFRLPKSARSKRVYIEFEGARQMAEVWLNGQRLGISENGVSPFGFDLTPYLRQRGMNRLEVLTDNDWHYRERATGATFQWNNNNFNANYGGLTKHVWLHVLGDVHQTLPLWSSFKTKGVYVYAEQMDVATQTARIVAESEVRNLSDKPVSVYLEMEVRTLSGARKLLARGASAELPAGAMVDLRAASDMSDIDWWSWGHGSLYDVVTRVKDVRGRTLDEVCTRTGFRQTEFGEGQIRLNGRTLMVHGYAQRTSNEWPGLGVDLPAWLSDYSNSLMVSSGANLVRWMHVMPSKQDVRSCDRVGLLQALPAGDAEKDVEGRQWEHRVELMADAIVYNRNNPSVLFSESGNKGISEAHMQEMLALRHRFDPHGGRAIGSREMLSPESAAEYGGEMLYINTSATKPVWAMEYCRDEGLRRYPDAWSWPYHKEGDGPLYRNADASAYNHNQDELAVEHVRRWYDYWQVRPGTGKRVSSGGVKIVFSDTNTHCRGESNYRTSGVVDAMRLPKDSYFAHQVMWNGWVEPESPDIYVMGHWNYPEGTVKPIRIVCNTDSVRLFLNGRELPSPRREYQYLWTLDSVRFEPGELVAQACDKAGNVLRQYRLQTVGEAQSLRVGVTCSPNGFVADGSDVVLVEFAAVDSLLRTHPLDHRTVRFTLEGPAEWIGGIGKGERNCVRSMELPLECGVNRALIRSTTTPGRIRLTAQADGFEPVVTEWESGSPGRAVLNERLVHWKPAETHPLRGSTPATPSYIDSKRTIDVRRVTAGCNSAEARLSHDDNETTEWRNDGRSATAWIRYELSEPTRIDEVLLKLAGWRSRSYPIEIVADDGTILWAGSTPQSLGYVLLPLNAQRAVGAVTIRLKGTSTTEDAFGQVVELAEPVANELDLAKEKDGGKERHELRIIECDFLQHLP